MFVTQEYFLKVVGRTQKLRIIHIDKNKNHELGLTGLHITLPISEAPQQNPNNSLRIIHII